MVSSRFPLAIVVRVSASVNIVVPMQEATKEALALHTLRKGEREKETDSFVFLCVPSEQCPQPAESDVPLSVNY
jgi:hypothetical protein